VLLCVRLGAMTRWHDLQQVAMEQPGAAMREAGPDELIVMEQHAVAHLVGVRGGGEGWG
jgi:hypothetical protein